MSTKWGIETKHRARTEILHFVLSYSVANRSSDGTQHCWASEPFFSAESVGAPPVPIGTIVIVSATRRATKWTIGWMRDKRYRHAEEYLIESLDDGEACWWTNVGLKYLDPEQVKVHPHWSWTDRQFSFTDRWNHVCYKVKGADLELPCHPRFGDDYSVELTVRKKFSEYDVIAIRRFEDWRKLTKDALGKCYDDCKAELLGPRDEKVRLENEDAALAAAGVKP